jgi:hypothetical protein
MISNVCAEVLKELKRLGKELPIEHEIALHEFEHLSTTHEGDLKWKKKSSLTLI